MISCSKYGYVLGLLFLCCVTGTEAQTEPLTSLISLDGNSSGGTLSLARAAGANNPYVLITNQPGETAALVLSNLVFRLRNSPVCRKWYGEDPVISLNGNTVVLLGGAIAADQLKASAWILAGTDDGFAIPPPPGSASIIKADTNICIRWVNAPTGYDSILVLRGGMPWVVLPGNASQYAFNPKLDVRASLHSDDEIILTLVGYKSGRPSNGSGIRASGSFRQEALMNMPFTKGLAPGFRQWAFGDSGTTSFEQGNLPNMAPESDVRQFRGRGFYQIITGNGSFCGGVARSFLGLSLGHSYRIRARMNTFETRNGEWSFTLNASPNVKTGEDLSSAQMAGLAGLPNHANESAAGQIVRFDSTKTTEGKWAECASGAANTGAVSSDVFLPLGGGTSITIWFRFEGKDMPECSVGLDSVSIEDLGEKK